LAFCFSLLQGFSHLQNITVVVFTIINRVHEIPNEENAAAALAEMVDVRRWNSGDIEALAMVVDTDENLLVCDRQTNLDGLVRSFGAGIFDRVS
jgi:hypothetical protein